MKPCIVLVQPPFVQLNGPHPGIYYLRTFLEKRGCEVVVRDHSILLFEKIFCKDGMTRIFASIKKSEFKEQPAATRQIIERFLCEEERVCSSIDRIIAFLRGKDREFAHLIGLTNGVLPGGPSFDACLAEICKVKGEASADDAPLLASKLLADIAGLITAALDPGFSLVRYVPMAAAAFHDFSAVKDGLSGYVMQNFYRPFLEEEWKSPEIIRFSGSPVFLMGITIPFPGCLSGALVCAESAKTVFGNRVRTIAGGGYVNTELRFLEEDVFFDYFDYLSFDRGYGSLDAILEREAQSDCIPLYKTMYRHTDGSIVRDASITGGETGPVDDEAVLSTFPDYSGVDFTRYICPVDDVNPMHRLWSDGRWLKACTAHGCYWQKCAFCDVSLDYIRSFVPVDTTALFNHLKTMAEASGIHGVHLVDEACPPASLLQLALLNRRAGLPLVFWGNIRFEKSFTPDVAALLAAGGVIGVSGGIEIASEKGFERIGKGIDLQGLVNACAAFKEAGILVHAYLIYGYWDQEEAEIIDSAEVMRQFFEAGLLDSAFWHQFVLTVHSRIYAEKQKGLHPLLNPRGGQARPSKIFALNDISFEGEERFDRFNLPLENLLRLWMKGDTSMPVQDAFSFRVKCPVVEPHLIASLLDRYARGRDKSRRYAPMPH
ncbi:MAG: radical SAM protein, partial [Treponema sp.]|nr:radical SAM protein [Treponema sp.]